MLVGISWQETTASETLDSVTYGGVAMTRIGATNMVDLFSNDKRLVDLAAWDPKEEASQRA